MLQILSGTHTQRTKWDLRFLTLCKHISEWSLDPSTKVGSVITNGNRIISMGYNGFPVGIDDSTERLSDRDTKMKMIIHAEMNAILFAKEPLIGYTLYSWPLPSCNNCAKHIIQTGIKRVVSIETPSAKGWWKEEIAFSKKLLEEAGITVDFYKGL